MKTNELLNMQSHSLAEMDLKTTIIQLLANRRLAMVFSALLLSAWMGALRKQDC